MPRGIPKNGIRKSRKTSGIVIVTSLPGKQMVSGSSLVSFTLPSSELIELELPISANLIPDVKINAPAGTIVRWMASGTIQ